jgi:hypothetical protein
MYTGVSCSTVKKIRQENKIRKENIWITIWHLQEKREE